MVFSFIYLCSSVTSEVSICHFVLKLLFRFPLVLTTMSNFWKLFCVMSCVLISSTLSQFVISWLCLSDQQTHEPSRPEELDLLAKNQRWGHGVRGVGLRHVQSAAENTVILRYTDPTLVTMVANGAVLTNKNIQFPVCI